MSNNIVIETVLTNDEKLDSSFIAPTETFKKIAQSLSKSNSNNTMVQKQPFESDSIKEFNIKLYVLQVKCQNLKHKYDILDQKINNTTIYTMCLNVTVFMLATGVILFISKK